MSEETKPVPEGYATISAYLVVEDSKRAMDFYAEAFGAERGHHMPGPGGRGTMHAEMRLGDSTFMLSDANPTWGTLSAKHLGGSPVSLHVYVEDADAVVERAIRAGCEVKFPINDTFWGDRYAKLVDPFGIEWGIATHKEEVGEAELRKRAEAWFAETCQDGGPEE